MLVVLRRTNFLYEVTTGFAGRTIRPFMPKRRSLFLDATVVCMIWKESMPNHRLYATAQETLIALNALTPQDRSNLIKDASAMIKGSDYSDPHELLNEAYLRCLDLRRPWPYHVAMTTYLYFSMKSLSSADHLPQSHTKECSLQEFEDVFGPDAISFLGGVSPSTENIYFQNTQRKSLLHIAIKVREHFENDLHATLIIDSWLDNIKNREFIEESGMSKREYDSARNRISRHLKVKRNYYLDQLE